MIPKLIIAVKSHFGAIESGAHDAIRSTWGQALRGRAEVKFFLGRPSYDIGGMSRSLHPTAQNSYIPKSDEVILECPDDYHSLPLKTRAICKWATDKHVDHIFLCDNDTYVNPKKILTCGYQMYDYAGKISRPISETFPYDAVDRDGVMTHIENCYPWASGGFGYFLSKLAIQKVADKYPKTWAEDLWVGQVLGVEIIQGNLLALDLPAGTYSQHFPSAKYGRGYDPSLNWMQSMHAENQ